MRVAGLRYLPLCLGKPMVDLRWRHHTETAMAMFAVIPWKEETTVTSRVLDTTEGSWKRRVILQRLELLEGFAADGSAPNEDYLSETQLERVRCGTVGRDRRRFESFRVGRTYTEACNAAARDH